MTHVPSRVESTRSQWQASIPGPTERLDAGNVIPYLVARRVLADDTDSEVRELAGGISNTVLRIDSPSGAVVVKQSLPVLRVQQHWAFDPRRIVGEWECMRALGSLLAAGSVPEVLDVDEELLAFTMTCAPEGGRVWKNVLLGGAVDLIVALRAGDVLGRIHRETAADDQLARTFDDVMPLIEGRIDPYHRAVARAHPDLAAQIEADVDRLMTNRRALVLGDYSPKNLIVYPDRVLVLDFEVAHWGDPAFDAAFMLAHLLGKAVHLGSQRTDLLTAAGTFWASYHEQAGPAGAAEAEVAQELSVLLLARVDGKSRLEYLTEDERVLIRELARQLIKARPARVLDVIGTVADRLGERIPAPGSGP